MTMRNRRPQVPRMAKVFTTTEVALTLVAANISVSSQQLTNQMTSDYESLTGKAARNVSVGRVWVTGLWFTLAVVSTPVLMGLSMGMGIFTQNTDAGDFPDLATHKGDWFLHRTWRLTDRGSATANPTPLQPEDSPGNSSGFGIDNRTGRKIPRQSDDLFLMIQKDIATEENIQLHCDVTVMWNVGP